MRRDVWLIFLVGTLLWSAPTAGKTLQTAAPIREIIPYIACDVCRQAMHQASYHANETRRNATESGKKLTEDRIIEEVIEPLCNPHLDVGDYLRQVDWSVDASAGTVKFQLRNGYGVCQRKCWTAAEACRALTSSEAGDALSGLLFRGVPHEKLQEKVCQAACRRQDAALAKARTKKPAVLKAEWGSEPFKETDDTEKEVEAMMERMALGPMGGQGADVFTRAEMNEIRQAMAKGDLERLQELDPGTYGELDDDSFAALREMTGGEGEEELPVPEPTQEPPKKTKKTSKTPSSSDGGGLFQTLLGWFGF